MIHSLVVRNRGNKLQHFVGLKKFDNFLKDFDKITLFKMGYALNKGDFLRKDTNIDRDYIKGLVLEYMKRFIDTRVSV